LKTKILLVFLLLGLPITGWAQAFFFTYFDPCLQEYKTMTADMSAPIIVVYFGQVKAFSFEEVSRGDLDAWMLVQYNKYKNTSPCQGAAVSTNTTTTTSNTITLVNNVTNIASLDFSSLAGNLSGGVKVDVGSTANNSETVNTDKQDKNEGNTENNNSGSNGNNSSSGSNGGNGSSSSGGKGNQGGETPKEEPKETPTEQQIEEQKSETQNSQSQQSTKSSSKAKAEVQKPAILITGDIVGIQNTNSTQDARGTMSFTRVKGDGTASLGGSVDYMVNAKIANISIMKSWINTNSKGHKGINVLSNSTSLLPGTFSNTLVFVRVNSLKRFTGLYGGAATYGIMNKEPLISTLVLGGAMYKGKLTKTVDGTFILVAVYSPYMKYYTESILESQPILIPFVNMTYKLTKTFGFGLTGGGTYVTGADKPLNYQVLLGAKLIL
jgi:hypothetical protein